LIHLVARSRRLGIGFKLGVPGRCEKKDFSRLVGDSTSWQWFCWGTYCQYCTIDQGGQGHVGFEGEVVLVVYMPAGNEKEEHYPQQS